MKLEKWLLLIMKFGRYVLLCVMILFLIVGCCVSNFVNILLSGMFVFVLLRLFLLMSFVLICVWVCVIWCVVLWLNGYVVGLSWCSVCSVLVMIVIFVFGVSDVMVRLLLCIVFSSSYLCFVVDVMLSICVFGMFVVVS